MDVKLWCSLIRRAELIDSARAGLDQLLDSNAAPMEGDLIAVQALADQGAYSEVENLSGRDVRIYRGDRFVGVLGTRSSGTNPTAVLPDGPVRRGDRLSLVANGGIIARAEFVPDSHGGTALPVRVDGFFRSDTGRPANLRDGLTGYRAQPLGSASGRIIVVAGTSAEVGKTTFVCQALRVLRRLSPDTRAATVKACGTGRLSDSMRHLDAGASYVTDFVDHGWPSTYNIDSQVYTRVLEQMVAAALERAELAIIEIGGDLLEARAPEVLALAASLRAPVVLCAYDAMGARHGLDILCDDHGIGAVTLATMTQNPYAMSKRLGGRDVVDLRDRTAVARAVARIWAGLALPGKADGGNAGRVVDVGSLAQPIRETDLRWTGNHFLAPELVRDLVADQLHAIDFTRKREADPRPLRAALARLHGVDGDMVYVGVGSTQIIDAVLRFFADHAILDIIPNFHMARTTARQAGLSYHPVPVRQPDDLVPAVVAAAVSQPALVILSSPRNPLGYAFSEGQIRDLLDSFTGPVIVDEAYGEYADVDLRPLLDHYPRLILVRTLSKAWGLASLRVGYALSARIPRSFQREFLLPYSVSELSQRVACALLAHPEPVFAAVARTRHARQLLCERLRRLPGCHVWSSDANFVCVEHPDASRLMATLDRAGVQVAPLHGLRAYPQSWPRGMRISVPVEPIAERVVAILAGDLATGQ